MLISVDNVRDENARGCDKRQKAADKGWNSDCEIVRHTELLVRIRMWPEGGARDLRESLCYMCGCIGHM